MAWLNSNKKLTPFVSNRVNEIKSNISNADFVHINGTENVADLLTRGITLKNLKANSHWWYGPKWLVGKTETIPVSCNTIPIPVSNETELEPSTDENCTKTRCSDENCTKTRCSDENCAKTRYPSTFPVNVSRFSSWDSLILTITMVITFINVWLKKFLKGNFKLKLVNESFNLSAKLILIK